MTRADFFFFFCFHICLCQTFYQVLDLYVWLGLKFGVAQFIDLEKAQTIRDTYVRADTRDLFAVASCGRGRGV